MLQLTLNVLITFCLLAKIAIGGGLIIGGIIVLPIGKDQKIIIKDEDRVVAGLLFLIVGLLIFGGN